MFDIIAVAANISVIGYLAFEAFTSGVPTLSQNYIFLGYVVFTVLTLPMLISRSIFKQKMIGLVSALSFLYFPLEYILLLGISKLFNLDLFVLLLIGSYWNILFWNILLFVFVLSDEAHGDLSEDTLKNIFIGFIPALIYLLVFLYIRQPDSVVALDYLQHLAVPNQMLQKETFCFLPGQCSNLFLQHGYTTIYHTILGFLTTFIKSEPQKIFFVIDIVFPFVVSIPLFSLFQRNIGNKFWALIGVLTTLLVFVMGAYDFVFFIPQTFSLLLFLMLYQERRLTPQKMIAATLLLIFTHFIIGTFLSMMLWIQFFMVKVFDTEKSKNIAVVMLLVTTIFFVLANIAGFSVEKLVQADSVLVIGGLTNPYFPNNLVAYIEVLGPIIILLLLSTIYFFFQKRKEIPSYLAIEYILVATTAYFMAPTYANKFLIGIGIFASILIFRTLSSFSFKPLIKALLSVSLITAFLLIYIMNYKTYLRFYTQGNGTVSAVVQEDREIVNYLRNNSEGNRMVLSDPYTQIVIASLANQNTANAQYMKLESRQVFYAFLADPSDSTWEKLTLIEELKGQRSFSILYTSRLEESVKEFNISWLFNIYSLLINNNYPIKEEPEFVQYLQSKKGANILFSNSNFMLVSIE